MKSFRCFSLLGCIFLVAASLIATLFGSIELGTALSLAAVGIVVSGKEIDDITSLADLQEMRNKIFAEMQELRTKYSERSAGEGQPGKWEGDEEKRWGEVNACLLYTSPSPRDLSTSRMPSSA